MMEQFSWNLDDMYKVDDFEGVCEESLADFQPQMTARNVSSSSPSVLVLDREGAELVEAQGRKIAAMKSHSEAERRRRARINAHLDTLRSLVPSAKKMDKASLLAEVIARLRELKREAAEACNALLIPMDNDEIRVEQLVGRSARGSCIIMASMCCDWQPGILSNVRQVFYALNLILVRTEVASLGGRIKGVFVMTTSKDSSTEDAELCQFLLMSVQQALKSVLEKSSALNEFSLRPAFPNKRCRKSFFLYSG